MPFDTELQIELAYKSPNGTKNIVLSYPDDDMWISRAGKIKLIQKQIGGGQSMTDVANNESVNAQLYDQIFVSGDSLDIYEKSDIINRLAKCEVTDSAAASNGYEVTLKTPKGPTVHKLKMPSAKQVSDYRKSAVSIIEEKRQQKITINLRASVELYDALRTEVTGYSNGIPAIHKSAVVSEMLSLLERDNEDVDSDSF